MTYYRPGAEEIKVIRLEKGLTMAEIADLVCSSAKAWQQWEYGKRQMPAAIWALLTIRLANLDKLV